MNRIWRAGALLIAAMVVLVIGIVTLRLSDQQPLTGQAGDGNKFGCNMIPGTSGYDGNPCTTVDGKPGTCGAGMCIANPECTFPNDCEDGNACTTDLCYSGFCAQSNIDNCGALTAGPGESCSPRACCSNGTATSAAPNCTGGGSCVNNACTAGASSSFNCGNPNQVYCGQGVSQSNVCCAQGACQTASNGMAYCQGGVSTGSSEGDRCATQVGCWYEMCIGNLWVCEDGDPCTDDKCTAGGDQNGVCEHQPWAIPIDGCTSSAGGTGGTGGDTGGSSNANSGGSSGGSSTGSSGATSSTGSIGSSGSTGNSSTGSSSTGNQSSAISTQSSGGQQSDGQPLLSSSRSSSAPPCIPGAPAPFGCPPTGSSTASSQVSPPTSTPTPGSSVGSTASSAGGNSSSNQSSVTSVTSLGSSSAGSSNSSSSNPCPTSSSSIRSLNSSSSHSSSSAVISPCSAGSSTSTTPVSHTACIQFACVLVDGPGVNTCVTSADCGGGSSASTSFPFSFGNSSFSFTFSNPAQHTVCQNAACAIVAGPGANECSTTFQCGVQNHLICRNLMCEIVPGPGGNQCDDAFDCLFSFSSTSFGTSFSGTFSSASFSFGFTSSAAVTYCGDGVIQQPESCDNALANSDAADGACRSDCTPARCGDYVVDVSRGETCDQGIGNKNDVADRCRLSCQLPGCGDGMKDSGEQCDDGNLRNGDGCSATCNRESVLVAGSSCGDGRLDKGEACDDGNRRSGDGCSTTCLAELTLEVSSEARSQGNLYASALLCGDGVAVGFEECDDGNLRDRDGCTIDCYLERGFCGDGVVQRALGETCEPALHDKTLPYICNPATCRLLSRTCGDGKIDLGEECDLGAENNKATPGAACRPDCSFPRCGDRIIDPSESCDDGNRLSGDGCSASCTLEQGAATTVPFPSSQPGTSELNALQGFSLGNQAPLWATLPVVNARAPIGDTGPAAVAVIASGAAAGFAYMRRKRTK